MEVGVPGEKRAEAFERDVSMRDFKDDGLLKEIFIIHLYYQRNFWQDRTWLSDFDGQVYILLILSLRSLS